MDYALPRLQAAQQTAIIMDLDSVFVIQDSSKILMEFAKQELHAHHQAPEMPTEHAYVMQD
jgi:hypothetical protein